MFLATWHGYRESSEIFEGSPEKRSSTTTSGSIVWIGAAGASGTIGTYGAV